LSGIANFSRPEGGEKTTLNYIRVCSCSGWPDEFLKKFSPTHFFVKINTSLLRKKVHYFCFQNELGYSKRCKFLQRFKHEPFWLIGLDIGAFYLEIFTCRNILHCLGYVGTYILKHSYVHMDYHPQEIDEPGSISLKFYIRV
jgi:hypothetical protein